MVQTFSPRLRRFLQSSIFSKTLRTQFLSSIVGILAPFHMDFGSTAITLAREDLEVVGSSIRRQRYLCKMVVPVGNWYDGRHSSDRPIILSQSSALSPVRLSGPHGHFLPLSAFLGSFGMSLSRNQSHYKTIWNIQISSYSSKYKFIHLIRLLEA